MTMTVWQCIWMFLLAYVLVNGILACLFVLIAARRSNIIDRRGKIK